MIANKEQINKYKEISEKVWEENFLNLSLIDIQIIIKFLENQCNAQLIQKATGNNPYTR